MQRRQVVGELEGRPQFERELLWVERRVKLVQPLGRDHLLLHQPQPGLVSTGDGVVQWTRLSVELRQHLGEKTATREDAALDVREVGIAQALEARETLGGIQPGAEHLPLKDLFGRPQRFFLQSLPGAEVRKHSALAHTQLPCEAPDGQAAQPLDGGQPHGCIEDLGVSLFPVRASARATIVAFTVRHP